MAIRLRGLVAGFTLLFAGALSLQVMQAQGTAPAAAPALDAIVAQHIQASGGAVRIKAVRSLKQTGHVAAAGLDAPAAVTFYSRRPNMVRQEMAVPGGTLISAFDGVTAWQIDPRSAATPAILTGGAAASLQQQAEFDTPLLDYKARGTTVALVGTEADGARKLFHLKITDKQGRVQHCYLDTASGLAVKVTGDSEAGATETQFADYRDVAGLKLPFSIRSYLGGTLLAEITFDSIQADVPMDDALFKMPR